MAKLHIRETFTEVLTEYTDLAAGEKNLPISGIVVAIDSFDSETTHLAVMLEEGAVINLKVKEELWNSSWKNVVEPGKVIEFEADVQNALSGTFILTTKSVPKVKKELYNFKRNDVPTENLTNAAFFVEVIRVYDKKDNHKDNSPLVVGCRTANGDVLYLKSFGGLPAVRAEKSKPGMILYMGPVSFQFSTHQNKDYANIYTNPATVVQVYTGAVNNGPAIPVLSLCQLVEHETGAKIAITGVVLRDIADGCTYIVDRPGSLDEEVTRPPRVGLVKIPSTYTFKSGDVVNITALVYTYDAIRLEYLSLEAVQEDNDQAVDALLDFKMYKPMLIEVPVLTSPGFSNTPLSNANTSYDETKTPTGTKAKKSKFT